MLFGLFGKKQTLEDALSKTDQLQNERDQLKNKIEDLEDEKSSLSSEVKQLKLDRKIELEDIEHMMKMKGERLDIELQKKIAINETEYNKKVNQLHADFHKKTEAQMQKEIDGMQKMYGQILERLPNVNAKLSGKI